MDRKSWLQLILEVVMFTAQSVMSAMNQKDVRKTQQ